MARGENLTLQLSGSMVNAKVTDALVAGITSYTYVNTDESDRVEKSSELEELVAEDFDSL